MSGIRRFLDSLESVLEPHSAHFNISICFNRKPQSYINIVRFLVSFVFKQLSIILVKRLETALAAK